MNKIKKGDQVVALCGKDKGKRGTVLRVIPDRHRVVVEGVNIRKKHVKQNPKKNITGGVVAQEASIHLANVALYNPSSKKKDKVGIKRLEDGRRVRIFKSSGELVDI